ncbi:MAG: 50S ribosomal protein L29 [Candidatus Dadabacteria bacterium]|nr:MAG: 50S ribosomal protein L29 [Candidatus Dadabacteria bacterium]
MKRSEFMREINELPVEALKLRARELGEELLRLRFRQASGQLEHSHRLKEARRNLARVKTVIARKQSEATGSA